MDEKVTMGGAEVRSEVNRSAETTRTVREKEHGMG